MLDIIHSWRTRNNLRKNLLAFLAEMEKNLETYYVIDQRQFITGGFAMNIWTKIQDSEVVKRQEAIRTYAESLLDFNKAFDEHKSFEKWYTSDIQNKTPENAKKLHTLKGELDQRVRTLEPIIILAGQALEKELLNLGFITT